MRDRHCIFCGIIARVESAFIVYENAHAVVFLSGTAWVRVRTVMFTVAFLALMVLAWEILVNYKAVLPAG